MTQRKRRTKKRVLWSVTRIAHPQYPGYTLRVTELAPGGKLFAVRMVAGRQKMACLGCTRTELGTTEREQQRAARAKAFEIIEALATGKAGGSVTVTAGDGLTLNALADLYEKHGLHGRTSAYGRDQVARIRRLAAFVGADRPVVSLCQSDADAYAAHRRTTDHVSAATVHGDVDALKIALNFATRHKRADGQPVLSANPLAGVRVPRNPNPRRPRADENRYQMLRAVAHQLPPAFGLALDLCWATGHRIGAVRHLRWEHILFDPETAASVATELDSHFGWIPEHFPYGGIRFYATKTTDNKSHDHVSPMTALAHHALKEAQPDITTTAAWILAAPKDPRKPVGYHVLKRWMRRAEQLAGLPPLPGGIWHPLRRGWATARKHFPAQDLAVLGGWRDVSTMQRCYQQAEGRTIRAIVDNG